MIESSLVFLDKVMVLLIAAGLLLPTMHQSSLGTVMLLAGPKLHGLWYTGWIPLLFLVSCVGMGYAVVVWESALSSRVFGRRRETSMLVSLSTATAVTTALFLIIRFLDLIFSGKVAMMFSSGLLSVMFWLEIALFAVPMVMLLGKGTVSFATMLRASILLMLAGSLYRFDAYIVAYDPGPGWSYFPILPELFITLGIIALEITLYIVIVKRFPILSGAPSARSAQ